MIYVIDSTCDEDEMNQNRTELDKAMDNEELDGLPLLVLANQQDKLGARKPSEVSLYSTVSEHAFCVVVR